MDQQKNTPENEAERAKRNSDAPSAEPPSVIPAPTSDQTNPHNEERVGDWVANSRASERKNNEPGLTDEERKQRRW